MSAASHRQYLELAELAGGFIHEIKNHLNTLSLNLQLLGEDFENPQTPRERKAHDRVGKLNDECRRIVELSNDFLRFARVTDLHCVPTNLGDLITGMGESIAGRLHDRYYAEGLGEVANHGTRGPAIASRANRARLPRGTGRIRHAVTKHRTDWRRHRRLTLMSLLAALLTLLLLKMFDEIERSTTTGC